LPQQPRAHGGIARARRSQHLQNDQPLQLPIARFIDDAHAPGAELFQHLEMGNFLTGTKHGGLRSSIAARRGHQQSPAKLVGRTPWSARSPLAPLGGSPDESAAMAIT